jgi:hypothetical protein
MEIFHEETSVDRRPMNFAANFLIANFPMPSDVEKREAREAVTLCPWEEEDIKGEA